MPCRGELRETDAIVLLPAEAGYPPQSEGPLNVRIPSVLESGMPLIWAVTFPRVLHGI